jgi:hypothetical protein
MIEFWFRCFCERLQRAPQGSRWWLDIKNSEQRFKYIAKLSDLRRYLNSLLFCYTLLTTRDESLALNRIGTHPVANVFGLIGMTCKWKHKDPAFLQLFPWYDQGHNFESHRDEFPCDVRLFNCGVKKRCHCPE